MVIGRQIILREIEKMLSKFYTDNNVPVKYQIEMVKDILFIVPERNYELKGILNRLGLSKWEIAVTYPKEGVDLISEVLAVNARLVIQVGKVFDEQFLYLPDDGSLDNEIKSKIELVLPDRFVGLHHHDEFSIKDGLGSVEQLATLLKKQRRSFCCVTNHGSVGGWIKQYNTCKREGLKAIFGCEIYVSNYRGDDIEEKKKHRSSNHLILLAKNMEGFYNIIKIHNDAQINGFYYTPRANHKSLREWGKGIIGSSACMAGEFPQLLMQGRIGDAKILYEFYKNCFDEFYIELQIIEFELQREVNRKLIEFAKLVGAPLLLTNDSHYLEPDHCETHDILMCIRQHKTLFDEKGEENEDVWNFDVRNLYYRNFEQMYQVFKEGFVDKNGIKHLPFCDDIFTEDVFNEAISNTRKIAISTEDIKLDSTLRLPKIYEDGAHILREKINKGFKNKELDKKPNYKDYIERIAMEYNTIVKLGWADYFLVMEKIVSDTVEEFGEWAIGYGRGSCGSSLVAYCLGLTDIDPIRYGLLFERFISADRGNITSCTFEL